MDQQLLTHQLEDGIATLTLNNPETRNALSTELLQALKSDLNFITGRKDIRSVIIASTGTVFSSGHDLRELINRNEEAYRRVFTLSGEVMEAIRLLPQPVIAQVQGLATAAGCQLVAACDLAVASEDALFATPGVRIGLFCTTPGVSLARAVPRKKAMEMLLTGEPITAQEALQYGLVNSVVPAEDLAKETRALAAKVTESSAYVVALGKKAFQEQVEMDIASAYQFAQRVMVENLLEPDAREGISAFLSKREPIWNL